MWLYGISAELKCRYPVFFLCLLVNNIVHNAVDQRPIEEWFPLPGEEAENIRKVREKGNL